MRQCLTVVSGHWSTKLINKNHNTLSLTIWSSSFVRESKPPLREIKSLLGNRVTEIIFSNSDMPLINSKSALPCFWMCVFFLTHSFCLPWVVKSYTGIFTLLPCLSLRRVCVSKSLVSAQVLQWNTMNKKDWTARAPVLTQESQKYWLLLQRRNSLWKGLK